MKSHCTLLANTALGASPLGAKGRVQGLVKEAPAAPIHPKETSQLSATLQG